MEPDKVINILKQGGLVVFPSDTVYGLLCDATREKAVKKLIAFKSRPMGKAISVFVSDFKMMKDYVELSSTQEKILESLLPGPFTVILKSKHKVRPELESEEGTLGVRIPAYDSINQLIKSLNKPVTATSANISGRPAHYSISTLLKELSTAKKQLIDLIIDAGQLPRNKPSTVIDLTVPNIKTLRRGDLDLKSGKTFISVSPSQTEKIGQFILEKNLKTNKPLFIIIEGELGVGKTVFVKGMAKYFGITNIISPSYVIYYEYKLKKAGFKNFIHADLYNVEKNEELDNIGLDKYFHDKNIICFEWGEKMGSLFEKLKKYGSIVYVTMQYINRQKREISVNYVSKI